MTEPITPSLPAARREHLLDVLRRDGLLRVSDVSAALGVTPVTIRRDIALLAREGLVRRVHGGATLSQPADRDGLDNGAEQPQVDGAKQHQSELTLGIVVPSLEFYWPGVIRGAREAAAEAGLRIVLRGSSYESTDDLSALTGLVDVVGVDGLLVAPSLSGPTGAETVAWLHKLQQPVVLVERTAATPPYQQSMESVVTDHALGANMAVRHLADLGHRRIGLFVLDVTPTAPHILQGWKRAIDEMNLPVGPDLEFSASDHQSGTSHDTIDAVLDACFQSGVTALLVHSDPEAISLVERCEERGISVPGDLSVVAYDDEIAALAHPPLTAIRPPRESIGRAAIELMTARLRTMERPAHRIVISPELVIRQSTESPNAS